MKADQNEIQQLAKISPGLGNLMSTEMLGQSPHPNPHCIHPNVMTTLTAVWPFGGIPPNCLANITWKAS